jgi:2-methylaconitate cis-trans-isomerase PrpF
VAKPADYVASSGKAVKAGDVDLLVRAVDGQAAPRHDGHGGGGHRHGGGDSGTLVNLAAGGGERNAVRFGHPSGTLRVGAEATR